MFNLTGHQGDVKGNHGYDYTYTRMVIIIKNDSTKYWQRCGAVRTAKHYWWDDKQLIWKTNYDSIFPFRGIHPPEVHVYQKTLQPYSM